MRAFEVWVSRIRKSLACILNIIVPALVGVAFVKPHFAIADHAPDSLTQDVDPNYFACLMSVDDAKLEFLDALQSTCLTRMLELCSGSANEAPASQVVECISFETRRGSDFLLAAEAALPDTALKTGLFWRNYQQRRDSIVRDVEAIKALAPAESIDVAVQQSVLLATAANVLFYLARETGTPLDDLAATFDLH